ncbi:MAG: hypothetical protein K1W10_17360 [Lachnospiraceae bacterium]
MSDAVHWLNLVTLVHPRSAHLLRRLCQNAAVYRSRLIAQRFRMAGYRNRKPKDELSHHIK